MQIPNNIYTAGYCCCKKIWTDKFIYDKINLIYSMIVPQKARKYKQIEQNMI